MKRSKTCVLFFLSERVSIADGGGIHKAKQALALRVSACLPVPACSRVEAGMGLKRPFVTAILGAKINCWPTWHLAPAPQRVELRRIIVRKTDCVSG